MTINIPHYFLKEIFDKNYEKTLTHYSKSMEREYQTNKTWRYGWFWLKSRELTKEDFIEWAKRSHTLKKICPFTYEYLLFISWASDYLNMIELGLDVQLHCEYDHDETYLFKKYFNINLIKEVSNAKIREQYFGRITVN